MAYTDLKITDIDNNKEVANKINTTLDNIQTDIERLESSSAKLYNMLDLNTGDVTPEYGSYEIEGAFRLCDPVALHTLMQDPEANRERITPVLYALTSILHLANIIQNPSDILGNEDYFEYFKTNYYNELLGAEPILYKQIIPKDENIIYVIYSFNIKGIIVSTLITECNKTQDQTINTTHYSYSINATVNNSIHDYIVTYIDAHITESEPNKKLKEAFDWLFNSYKVSGANSTGSYIAQPTYNSNGQLVRALPLLGRVLKDIVELEVDLSSMNKQEVETFLNAGNTVDITTPILLKINNGTITKIDAINTLSDYILLLTVKASDGELSYFIAVVNGGLIPLCKRIDNYSPQHIFELQLFFVPATASVYMISATNRAYVGFLNTGLLGNTSNQHTLQLAPPAGLFNNEYLSNSVIMGLGTDDTDYRMIFGVHNVVYPPIDLSDRPVSETEGSLNVLVSYNPLTGVEGGINNKPELGFIRGNSFKAANSTRLEGKEYIFTTKEEYDANMAAGTINNENVYLIPEIESASGSFAVRSINGIYPDGTGNIYIDKLGKSSIEVKQVTIVGALSNAVRVIPIPKNDNFAGLPLEVLKFVERAGTTVIMGGEMKLTNVEDFNITGGITLTDTAAMLNNTVKISSTTTDECLIDLSVLMQYEDWRIG